MKLILSGGRQRFAGPGAEWTHFGQALLLELDLESLSVREVYSYETPLDRRAGEDASVLFKAGTRSGKHLYLCTQTEILVLESATFKCIKIISLPYFNDVHHVAIDSEGDLYAVVTGLDLVVQLNASGDCQREWNVLQANTWQKFSRNIDYRKVLTTKPHPSHPNYVFFADGEVWATRHFQQDAIALTNPSRRMFIEVGNPHDGHVIGEHCYFTTVNGYIVVCDIKSGKRVETIDLSELFSADNLMGWCRGIHILPDGNIIVGFTKLRTTKYSRYMQWAKSQVKSTLGGNLQVAIPPSKTRICCINPTTRKALWEVELEEHGMDAVFSII